MIRGLIPGTLYVSTNDFSPVHFLCQHIPLTAKATNTQAGNFEWMGLAINRECTATHRAATYVGHCVLLQFNLAGQGLLDKDIAQSYMLIIRMFAGTKYFPDYWQKARREFNDSFAAYVDEQIEIVATTDSQ